MEKEVVKHHHHHLQHHHNINPTATTTSSSSSGLRERQIIGETLITAPQSTDFVLKWGNRKRLRCMKIQVKDSTTNPVVRTTARVDRRVIRNDNNNNNSNGGGYHSSTAPFNLRQRAASPAQRILRNSESATAMKGHQTCNNNNQTNGGGGGVRGLASPERKAAAGGGDNNVINRMAAASPEKGGSSSGGGDVVVWPPKFMIALTNKEKEEDFMAIKGSKLPQRPKKRAKFVQRTLNLVSPGGWLCDLTLERYEVREKKITKKRPRGLKAMGNYVDTDSE